MFLCCPRDSGNCILVFSGREVGRLEASGYWSCAELDGGESDGEG